MTDKYILKDGVPVLEPDIFAWGEWFITANRRVNFTKVGHSEISTVFLGLDYSFVRLGNSPVLYETLVFGGSLDGEMDRYSTFEEAVSGHRRMVARVQNQD